MSSTAEVTIQLLLYVYKITVYINCWLACMIQLTRLYR